MKFYSYQIVKQSFKSAWVWWIISVFVISLNLLAFSSTMGAENTGIELLKEFANTGIAFNGVVCVLICAILFANIFITSEVDRGTLAITLNTPTTRMQILLSKMIVFVLLLITISLVVGVIGSVAPLIFGAELDFAKWWKLTFLWSLYSLAVGGITFCLGCWFNKSRYTLATSAVVLGAFFILSMLAQMEDFEFCKYFTLQTLFDMSAVIEGKSVAWQMVTLPLVAIPLYVIGVVKFLKKDLPL